MKKGMLIGWLVSVLILIAACGAAESDSTAEGDTLDNYPEDDIEVLVGFSAGGGTDVIARTMGEHLNQEGIVEQSFVVENHPGAGGGIALQELLQKSGDSHVLLSNPDFATPVWDGDIDADYSDFTLLAQLATDAIVITTNPESPYETIEDVLEDLQEDPGSVNIGIGADIVSTEGFSWYRISEDIGVEYLDLNIVPQDGGSDLMSSLLGGHLDVAAIELSTIAGQIEAEELRPLATLRGERIEAFPDIPSLSEAGIDYAYDRPRGIWGAGDIPNEVVDYWDEAFEELTNSEIWQEDYIAPNHLINEYKSSEEYTSFIIEQAEEFAEFSEKYSN